MSILKDSGKWTLTSVAVGFFLILLVLAIADPSSMLVCGISLMAGVLIGHALGVDYMKIKVIEHIVGKDEFDTRVRMYYSQIYM